MLELGCGCGLSGLLASVLGAQTVFLTDVPTEVLHNAQMNAEKSSRNESDRKASRANAGESGGRRGGRTGGRRQSRHVIVRRLEWSRAMEELPVSDAGCIEHPPLNERAAQTSDPFGWRDADSASLSRCHLILGADESYVSMKQRGYMG